MAANKQQMEKLMAPVPFVGNCQYKAPYSRELEGRAFDIIFDDGYRLDISFPTRDKVLWSENGEAARLDTCYCMKAEEGAYLLMTEKKDSAPRTGLIMVLDLNTRLVTGNFVQQGTDPAYPKLVTRTVRFGYVRDGERPAPTERHYFTREMVGKKIEWAYSPEFSIIHVYLSENTYCFSMLERQKEQIRAEGRTPPGRIEEPTFYVHIRDNLVLISFVEKNAGSGTEGLFLINTDRVTDVGCFWGTAPTGDPEGYMFSAYGKWVTERVPEEDE